MKRAILILLLAGCSNARSPEKDPSSPLAIPPRPAPEFTLLDGEGREISLADVRGKIVVLNFWAAWCAACDGDLQTLQRVAARHPEDVAVIGISFQSGAQSQVAEFGRRIRVTFPLLVGTREVIDRYGVATYPTTFLIDRGGQMRYCIFNARTAEFWEGILSTLK